MSMIIDGTNGATFPDSSLQAAASSPYVLKNRIINGAMVIDQRNAGASQSVSNGSTTYTVDRWFMLPVGNAVTGQRVSNGSGGYNYQMTGASSVTSIYFGQRIESANSYDMAGQTVTLSVSLADSTLTSVAWTAYYANSTDNFSAVTSIASGTFTVNSTLTRYSTQISIPSAATTGIQIVFNVGAQTSGTWTVSNAQLEIGSTATPFERRLYGQELALCQRYYQLVSALFGGGNTSTQAAIQATFQVPMRAAPTLGQQGVIQLSDSTADYIQSSVSITNLGTTNNSSFFFLGNFAGLTVTRVLIGPRNSANTNTVTLSAEL